MTSLLKALFFGIIGIVITVQLPAQDSQYLDVSGKVVHADSLLPVASVHIFVLNEEGGTISNRNGFFSINMNIRDTLVFSSVNYETQYYSLSDSLRKGKPFIEIKLKPRVIQLREVVVYGQLNPAAVNRYLENVKNSKRYKNPADLQRKVPTSEPKTTPKGRKTTVGLGSSLQGGAALEGVLTGLANLFNKRAQQQKRISKLLEARRNIEAQKAYKEFIKSKFNQELVAEVTELEGYRLERFLGYCNFTDEFIYSATEYELLAAIFAKLHRFEKSNRRQ